VSNLLDKMTDGQKAAISEYIEALELDDAANSIENATRCLNEQGYHELQVMVHNHFYNAGINRAKNELREILGLPVMRTELEQKRFDYDTTHPKGSRVWWDCQPLQEHEFEIAEGSAKLIPLGEDGTSMVVIGTKDRKKAARMVRRTQRDWLETDLLAQDSELELKKLVWRNAGDEDGEHTHMFSWSSRDTKNNPKAVDAFVYEG
jgi:hypothetical protein